MPHGPDIGNKNRRTAHQKRYKLYDEGDPDPTMKAERTSAKQGGYVPCCYLMPNGMYCTWPAAHGHPQHIAGAALEGTTGEIIGIYPTKAMLTPAKEEAA